MKKITELLIPGAFSYEPSFSVDRRGKFSKLFNYSSLKSIQVEFEVRESFCTTSKKGDIRGMHLQVSPCATSKIVAPIEGVMFDVLLDLRVNSPAYGRHAVVELAAAENICLYVPAGVAHGFQVLSDLCCTLYFVNGAYSPAHDVGVRYDSFGLSWPLEPADVSERDLRLPDFGQFRASVFHEK